MKKANIKLFILFISTLFFVSSCTTSKNTKKSDVEYLNLLGKVKFIKTSNYRVVEKEGKIIIAGDLKDVFLGENEKFFNLKGNEIKSIEYNLNGSINEKSLTEYNNKGNKIKILLHSYKDSIKIKVVYKYDLNDNIIQQISYDKNEDMFSKEVINYNVKRQKVERKLFNQNGENNYIDSLIYDERGNKIRRKVYQKDSIGKFYLDIKYSFIYNDKDNLTESYLFNSDREMKIQQKKKFDLKGNVIEIISFDSDEKVSFKVVYKFDENGNKTERLGYNSNEFLSERNVYKYDNKGNEVEENVYNSDGILFHKKNYKYDNNGSMIEFISETPTIKNTPKYIRSWKFEYDKNKNWIKRVLYTNEIPESITEREIKYY